MKQGFEEILKQLVDEYLFTYACGAKKLEVGSLGKRLLCF